MVSDEGWKLEAACRGKANLLFPQTEGRTNGRGTYDAARALCGTCPVIAACWQDAIAHEKQTAGELHGFRAGFPPKERRGALRDARARLREAEGAA